MQITLNELLKIQGQDGNWNYDPYMHGMYNGLELAVATLENREPIFKSAPKVWLRDIKIEEPVVAEQVLNNNNEG